MTPTLVSIVLPTHNGSRFLEESIRSCLNQTYGSIELIVVDDASTDGTGEIAAQMMRQDSRVRVIRHTRNRKLPAALNTGFAAARGAYQTWTSDDNLYETNAIARMVEALEHKGSVGMVYADYRLIDEHGGEIGSRQVGEAAELLQHNCVGACFLYRREVVRNVGRYAEPVFLAEDYDYWLRVAGRFEIMPLHEPLYRYRVHGGALSQTEDRDRLQWAADRARSRNVWRLRGHSPARKAAVYGELMDRARWRGNYGWMLRNLLYGGAVDLGTMAAFLWRKLSKKLLFNGLKT